ncbi:uncharacterized protein LOC114526234 isoform X2 [Dendronephthya gigantea]|uniref:uncharacterized protein LOC114526234 isoform X2 n=1 Tax=Dendronephthya gigantea TaxID=151771 RepID=UPI0010691169|nr:uncharacterized protein LOC114526234 isoform X2 [Dendronephthya gigantea]
MPTSDLFTKPPQQPVRKPGQLSKDQVTQYFEEGFLLVQDFFKKEELEPVLKCIEHLVDELAEKLHKAGKIKEKYENASVFERLTFIDNEFPGAAILIHKYGEMTKEFSDLWTNERLLNVVEQFIGPEIAGHPVWNLRAKIPKSEQATVPWHQAGEVLVPTAWIPFLDTNMENGCMEVARYGHKSGVLAKHTCCAGPTWYVDLDVKEMQTTLGVDMENDVVLCEVPFGGVLFINNLVPHRSLKNYSKNIRWTMDLRWQVPDKPNGFYGLKENILLRTGKDPNHVIDWEAFAVDRNKLQENYVNEKTNIDKKEYVEDPEFDTTISGPWMDRWEIVNHNKHTDSFKKSST